MNMAEKPESKFILGDIVLTKDPKTGEQMRMRVDKRDYSSIGKEWKYSGQATPVKQANGQWVDAGKTIILLNIREKEVQKL